ncbi:MAG: hypothetical protein IKI51_01885 [Clostridia bacterium]|nr:hypothetical protein [Clostridia bacterium]
MKAIKRILAAALLVCLALSLTSCLALDDMKARRMEWDGNDIVFQGKTYRALPLSDYTTCRLKFSFNNYRVCDEEVPLLLIDRFGSYVDYDDDLDIICRAGMMYCTEEKYEEYRALFSAPVLDSFAFPNYSYDEEKGRYPELVRLDDKTSASLAEALAGDPIDKDMADRVVLGGGYMFGSLWRAMKTLDVISEAEIDIYDYFGTKYALVSRDEIYALPDELGVTLEKLLTDNWENEFFNGYEMIIER